MGVVKTAVEYFTVRTAVLSVLCRLCDVYSNQFKTCATVN